MVELNLSIRRIYLQGSNFSATKSTLTLGYVGDDRFAIVSDLPVPGGPSNTKS